MRISASTAENEPRLQFCLECGNPLMAPEEQASGPVSLVQSPSLRAAGDPISLRLFDLNIEEVLENWEIHHALREVIANALDEQVLSRTADIEISKDREGHWHVRDFGRGLRIDHFTLNENQEKLTASSGVIGKFGVGLKDALATFHRRGVGVCIRSAFGTYRLKQAHKHDFANITTLHVEYNSSATGLQGTDFILQGISDADVAKAKNLFLRFAHEGVLETSTYGQILRRRGPVARVYILGVLASEEPNFLFSYNITSLTDAMKKRLNRERLNVGRTTYADRVKAILKNASSGTVKRMLVEQVDQRAEGDQCDEMQWIEISQMALTWMSEQQRVVYFTEEELQSSPNILDNAQSDGYRVVTITEQQKAKLVSQAATGGPEVRTMQTYVKQYSDSFQYKFVELKSLTREERRIYDLTHNILALVGIRSERVPDVRISETMRVTNDDTEGVWDEIIPAIVIKRTKLASLAGYAGTLLHEAAHATSDTDDVTRAFELVLTDYLGRVAANVLRRQA
jgi:hypothetical protein